jgi:hypothetical protein
MVLSTAELVAPVDCIPLLRANRSISEVVTVKKRRVSKKAVNI